MWCKKEENREQRQRENQKERRKEREREERRKRKRKRKGNELWRSRRPGQMEIMEFFSKLEQFGLERAALKLFDFFAVHMYILS